MNLTVKVEGMNSMCVVHIHPEFEVQAPQMDEVGMADFFKKSFPDDIGTADTAPPAVNPYRTPRIGESIQYFETKVPQAAIVCGVNTDGSVNLALFTGLGDWQKSVRGVFHLNDSRLPDGQHFWQHIDR